MKLQILQEKLKEGLGIVEKISSKSLTLPILNNILIETEKNFLNLSATDLEIGIKWWALTKIEKEGKITAPSKLLSGFVGSLPQKTINIEAVKDILNLKCEEYNAKIKGFSAEEYPLIPKISKNEFISLNSAGFCRDLSQISDIPSPSNSRPEISGIYFSVQKNLITAAATDSFRLGEKKILNISKSSITNNYSLIIPQKTIKEVINIFGDKEGDITIYFSPNQIMFEILMQETDHPQIQLISRLIDGEYPNYKEIIPKNFSTRIILNKDVFLNQIKTASLFSGKTNEIKLKASPEKKEIQILSQSPELGEHQSVITAQITGEKAEVAFNYRFLWDGLNKADNGEVVLDLNSDSGPGVVRSEGNETYTYVAMPIKSA
ncbi:MAG: DNA polymerase III subunit beta [Nanoarchaeota archaeon]|nr:DNA polymerase III subunit beta [Nanoarchaeota archaeon]